MRGIDRNANRLQNVCLCQDGLWPIWPSYYHSTALLQMLQFWARLKLSPHSITEHSTVRPFALYSPVTLWYIETMNIVQVQGNHYECLTVSTPKGVLRCWTESKVVFQRFFKKTFPHSWTSSDSVNQSLRHDQRSKRKEGLWLILSPIFDPHAIIMPCGVCRECAISHVMTMTLRPRLWPRPIFVTIQIDGGHVLSG